MALVVNTNMPSIMVENMLNNTNNSLNNDLTQLSSGLRINSAADDPAGYAIGNAFKAAISSMNVASQNAAQAQSMLQTADGAYSQINNIMVQMKSLATEAASGQESSTNLSSLNNEFQDLASEINQIANSTVYGGTTLLANPTSSVLVTFQVGNVNSPNDQFLVTLSSSTTSDLGLSTLTLTSIGTAQSAMSALDTALTSINTMMGNVGGYQNQLTYLASNLTT
ncbi:MAG: flagellin, partial [Syntrophobacteraceae bacterium]